MYNIRFWLPICILAFRTKKNLLEPKQINALTGTSGHGTQLKQSLSLVSYENEQEKETPARRYRSVSRDLPSS